MFGAPDYVVPALQILDSRIELEGGPIVETILENTAMGAVVISGNPSNRTPWISAGCSHWVQEPGRRGNGVHTPPRAANHATPAERVVLEKLSTPRC